MNCARLVGIVRPRRRIGHKLDTGLLVLFLVVFDSTRVSVQGTPFGSSTYVGPMLTPILALVSVNKTETSSVLNVQVIIGSPSSQTWTLNA